MLHRPINLSHSLDKLNFDCGGNGNKFIIQRIFERTELKKGLKWFQHKSRHLLTQGLNVKVDEAGERRSELGQNDSDFPAISGIIAFS